MSDRKRLAAFYATLSMLGASSGVETDGNERCAVRAFPVCRSRRPDIRHTDWLVVVSGTHRSKITSTPITSKDN